MSEESASPSFLQRRLILIISGFLFASGTFGSNVGPAWVDERPAVVLALSSRNRNLFAAVPFIDPLAYSIIGFLRVLAAGLALFYLGRWHGDRALNWMNEHIGELPPLYRWFQSGIDRASWLFIIVMPGSNLVCMMAGHRRVQPRRFVPLLILGIILKLSFLWAGGKAFEGQIRSFLGWMEDYQWYVVGGLFALSFLQSARRSKRQIKQISTEPDHPIS